MSTYIELANRFPDYSMLDIVGDENNATKKMMMDLKVSGLGEDPFACIGPLCSLTLLITY
jgi:hypothetical protein